MDAQKSGVELHPSYGAAGSAEPTGIALPTPLVGSFPNVLHGLPIGAGPL